VFWCAYLAGKPWQRKRMELILVPFLFRNFPQDRSFIKKGWGGMVIKVKFFTSNKLIEMYGLFYHLFS